MGIITKDAIIKKTKGIGTKTLTRKVSVLEEIFII